MRDIKFRVWDTTSKLMHRQEVIEDYTIEQLNRLSLTNDPYTKFMQFTGLKDKNGIEIYEGDILINELGRVCFVKWHEHQAGFDCEFIKDTNYVKDTDMTLGFRNVHLHIFTKIIGNIHQNPELLESK